MSAQPYGDFFAAAVERFFVPVKNEGSRFTAVDFARIMVDQGLQYQLRKMVGDPRYELARDVQVEINGHLYTTEVLIDSHSRDEGLVETDVSGKPLGPGKQTTGDLTELAPRYRAWVKSTWLMSDGITPDTRVSLDSDFVEPAFTRVRVSRRGKFKEYEEARFSDVVRSPRAVVLGEPGSGKTSLLRKMAVDFSSQSNPHISGTVIPVYIQLRDVKSGGLSIDTVAQILVRNHGSDALPALRSGLMSGQLVLLVDGLDEIEIHEREETLQGLELIGEESPNIRIVLSSRESAYPRTVPGYAHFRIRPFDNERIASWSRRYCINAVEMEGAGASARAEQVGTRTWARFSDLLFSQPDVVDLVQNPLLLAVTTSLYSRYDVTPRHKTTLFEKYLDALLDEWDYSRGVVRQGQSAFLPRRARNLLRLLSSRTLSNERRAFDVSLFNSITSELSWSSPDSERALTLLAEMGVVRESDPSTGMWSFTHKSMEELLVARFLVDQTQALSRFFENNLDDPDMQRVWLLTVGMASDARILLEALMLNERIGGLKRVSLLADALMQEVPISRDLYELCYRFIRNILDLDLSDVFEVPTDQNIDLETPVAAQSRRLVLAQRPESRMHSSSPTFLEGLYQEDLIWRLHELRGIPSGEHLLTQLKSSSVPAVAKLGELLEFDGFMSTEWDERSCQFSVSIGNYSASRRPAWRKFEERQSRVRSKHEDDLPPRFEHSQGRVPDFPTGLARLSLNALSAFDADVPSAGGVIQPRGGDVELLSNPFWAAPEAIAGVSFSTGQGVLATAGDDGKVRLWDPSTGKQLAVLGDRATPITNVAFSRRGEFLAAAGFDGVVQCWDARSYSEIRVVNASDGPVRSVAFSPDGDYLVTGGDSGAIRIWSVSDGYLHHSILDHQGPVRDVTFSPDGRYIASASDDESIVINDFQSGEIVRTFAVGMGPVTSVSWSQDGRLLASGFADGTVRIWDIATGEVLRVLEGHKGSVDGLAFGANGSTISTSCTREGSLRVWSLRTGQSVFSFTGQLNLVGSSSLNVRGDVVVGVAGDTSEQLWPSGRHTGLHGS